MAVIRATVRDGKVVVDAPADWPDGTAVDVRPAEERIGMREEDWPTTPEGVEDWVRWFDSLEPLVLTPEDEARIAADRAERRAWFLTQADERERKLRGMFE